MKQKTQDRLEYLKQINVLPHLPVPTSPAVVSFELTSRYSDIVPPNFDPLEVEDAMYVRWGDGPTKCRYFGN